MSYNIPATSRSSKIEYAIRDVVVPAAKLEKQGIDVLKIQQKFSILAPTLTALVSEYKPERK